jgi:hypothetical protein
MSVTVAANVELARREARWKAIGEAKAEIGTGAAQRFAREQAEYEARGKAREEQGERNRYKAPWHSPALL